MTFSSILIEHPGMITESPNAPQYFTDLNLDQVIDAITASKQEYNLKPIFYTPLHDLSTVQYRHEVMRDLENRALLASMNLFAQKMRSMRDHITQISKLHYKLQKQSWFLYAVDIYCDSVNTLYRELSQMDLNSRGFIAFREFLQGYIQSSQFSSLLATTQQLKADLTSVRYSILISDNSFRVLSYEAKPDFSIEVEKTFEKFRQGVVKDYRVKLGEGIDMNHIEAKVLEFISFLYPDIFTRLDQYCEKNRAYLDETIKNFDREIQFYVAYLEHLETLKKIGLKFCYPQISNPRKAIFDCEGFDLALANKLLTADPPIITNDFSLEGKERIIVVSGPNQGGKTTFARTFGQLHYLASLGLPVPGRKASLYLFDEIFTHFEKEEDIRNLHGKLQDDLIRIMEILNKATSESIVIMNEIFTSTTLDDAIFLSKKVMERIINLDVLCVCVTFIDELSTLDEKTISMVSTVVPDNPAMRTFKIVRQPADGLSYALSIAEKYQLTYKVLKERLNS